eukprot:2657537-Rhodomonas_salina.3
MGLRGRTSLASASDSLAMTTAVASPLAISLANDGPDRNLRQRNTHTRRITRRARAGVEDREVLGPCNGNDKHDQAVRELGSRQRESRCAHLRACVRACVRACGCSRIVARLSERVLEDFVHQSQRAGLDSLGRADHLHTSAREQATVHRSDG